MKCKAEYLTPGAFMPEETSRELDEHDATEAAEKAPTTAYCFYLYDLPEDPPFEYDDELWTVLPKPQNRSARYYLGGELFTVDDIKAELETPTRFREDGEPEFTPVLLSNIEGNGYPKAIKCRMGNWQPFTDKDTLLDEPAHLVEAREKWAEAREDERRHAQTT